MKTVQDLIDAERNRQNPKFDNIVVMRIDKYVERHSNVANLKSVDGWLEFDTTCDMTNFYPTSTITTRHKVCGNVIEFTEII